MQSQTRQILTMMFTDIVGYSRLMGTDESRTIELLEHYRAILGAAIADHQGEVLEYIGDAIVAAFPNSLQGMRAALRIQRDLRAFNQDHDRPQSHEWALRTRVGLHTGPVLRRDGKLFGDEVNVAARLEPIAETDGICISRAVYREVRGALALRAYPLGELQLKGIPTPVHALKVQPHGSSFGFRTRFEFSRMRRRLRRHRGFATALLALLVSAPLYALWSWWPERVDAADYLRVDPFRNHSATDQDRYFSEGVAAALGERLTQLPGLYISSPETDAGARFRLEGSVQKMGERVRITYRLVQTQDRAQIAAGVVDGLLVNLLTLLDRLYAQLSDALREPLQLTGLPSGDSQAHPDFAAFDLYMRAQWRLREQTQAGVEASIAQFGDAIAQAPAFALARAGLCRAMVERYRQSGSDAQAQESARQCRAQQTESSVAEPFEMALGELAFLQGDYARASRHFGAVLDAQPGHEAAALAQARALEWADEPLAARDALAAMIAAHPGHWRGYAALGDLLRRQGEFVAAAEQYRRVLVRTPQNPQALFEQARLQLYLGNYDDALAQLRSVPDTAKTSEHEALQARIHYYRDEPELALNSARAALDQDPTHAGLLFWSWLAQRAIDPAQAHADDSLNRAYAAIQGGAVTEETAALRLRLEMLVRGADAAADYLHGLPPRLVATPEMRLASMHLAAQTNDMTTFSSLLRAWKIANAGAPFPDADPALAGALNAVRAEDPLAAGA